MSDDQKMRQELKALLAAQIGHYERLIDLTNRNLKEVDTMDIVKVVQLTHVNS